MLTTTKKLIVYLLGLDFNPDIISTSLLWNSYTRCEIEKYFKMKDFHAVLFDRKKNYWVEIPEGKPTKAYGRLVRRPILKKVTAKEVIVMDSVVAVLDATTNCQ